MSTSVTAKLRIFADRFHQLRGEMSQGEFADFLEISRPTVGFYENGSRLPDAVVIKKICEKCKVSSDWLLGMSDAKTLDIEMKAMCQYTGLSIKTLEMFHNFREHDLVYIFDFLVETNDFTILFYEIARHTGILDKLNNSDNPLGVQVEAEVSEYKICKSMTGLLDNLKKRIVPPHTIKNIEIIQQHMNKIELDKVKKERLAKEVPPCPTSEE